MARQKTYARIHSPWQEIETSELPKVDEFMHRIKEDLRTPPFPHGILKLQSIVGVSMLRSGFVVVLLSASFIAAPSFGKNTKNRAPQSQNEELPSAPAPATGNPDAQVLKAADKAKAKVLSPKNKSAKASNKREWKPAPITTK